MNLKKYILNVKDFPKKGINFKDITGILKNPAVYEEVINELVSYTKQFGATSIAAPGGRGFWFAPLIAQKMMIPFIPIRKKGKLPPEKYTQKYTLEYGHNYLEIKKNSFNSNDKVVIFDDILATGGTIKSAIKLVEKANGNVVGCIFLADLKFLNGVSKIKVPIKTLLTYEA